MLRVPVSYSAGCCPPSLEWVVGLKWRLSCGSGGPMIDHRLRNLESVGKDRVLLKTACLRDGCFPSLQLVYVQRVPMRCVLLVNDLYGHPRLGHHPAQVLSSGKWVFLKSVPVENGSVHSGLGPFALFVGFGHPVSLS